MMMTLGRRWISVGLLLIFIAAIIHFLWSQPEILKSLKNVTISDLLFLVVVRLGIFAMNGLFLKEFAAKFGVLLSFNEWFGLAAVTTMGNYVTPFSGGLFFRAAYLKKRHSFPYTQFTTMLTSNYLIMFWLIGVIGLVSLRFLGRGWQPFLPITLLFGGVSMTISILFLCPIRSVNWDNRIGRFLNSLLAGWLMVKRDYVLLFRLMLLTILTIGFNTLSFWLVYNMLGQVIPVIGALLLGLVAAYSIFINLTPGNLGVQEAMVGLSAELIGVGGGEGIMAVLLIRAVTVICAFCLGPIYSYRLSRSGFIQ